MSLRLGQQPVFRNTYRRGIQNQTVSYHPEIMAEIVITGKDERGGVRRV